MIIVLDTGCIDFFLHDSKYKEFKRKIFEHEKKGDTIATTIINYAERKSGLNKWIGDEKFKQIIAFFDTVKKNKDLLFLSEKTANLYADIHYKIKFQKNSISDGDLKSMHNDIWIASLCIEHSCKIYTSNKNDFKKIKEVDESLNFEYVAGE